jgi:PPOX class probable F420-dependent enzyme
MTIIPESVRAVLESSALAHLVTLEPDGSPQVSIIWVGLDGEEIVAGHLAERRKVRNIRHDPRVVLSFEANSHNERGLVEYLVIHGTARISEGGAPLLLQRLAHTYLGPDVEFPPPGAAQPGFITHITIDRISGVGPWAS